MPDAAAPPLSVLICAPPDSPLPGQLRARGAVVVTSGGGLAALVRALQSRPDVAIVDAGLPGIPALDLCRALHGERTVGAMLPTLVLVRERPTPEQRVEGLQVGVWEFVRYAGPRDFNDLWLTVQAYAQAKRNIDEAIAEGLADPVTGLLSGPGLVRRGRELLALMARERAAVACLVFSVSEGAPGAPAVIAAGTSRISDAVGALDGRRFAIIAPDTDEAGAMKLAERLRAALQRTDGHGDGAPEAGLRVGYHAVGHVGYEPIDSAELVRRATIALESGVQDPLRPWVRRYEHQNAPQGATGRARA